MGTAFAKFRTKGRQVFTTGQIAKICKVAPRTVTKWVDAGRLPCHRLPGSTDRRIARDHLIRFLKDHHFPLGELETEQRTSLLLVCVDPLLAEHITTILPATEYRITHAASGFAVGYEVHSATPDVIVVDYRFGRPESRELAGHVRQIAERPCMLIALVAEDHSRPDDESMYGFDQVYQQPVSAADLCERIYGAHSETE